MPVFISGGGTNAVHQLSYGNVSQATVNFLQGQLASMQSTPYFQGFYNVAQQQFENINGEAARRIADTVIRNSESLFQNNVIRSLSTMEQLQVAPLVMQRWLMTSELLRNQAALGRIDGYKETYVNKDPGMNGIFQRDWRLLNQGVVREVEDGDWMVKQCFEEWKDTETPLTVSQRVDVFDSISFAEAYVKAREEDPTSPYGDFM